jgi:hypothetical protein
MIERTKTMLAALFGTASPFAAVGFSLETRLESWLRILTLFSGFITALTSVYYIRRINRTKVLHEQAQLCEDCENGHPPRECPIPEADRPDACPLNRRRRYE